ncbi:hypothetical protein H0E87_016871 [Populus deltoides]|uniref:Uncharacterized protein n=1 Tax=Populus deltoides TaxID=3696 RepID=A0A8T2XY22_POPDE|nr:hypothetical protein H0E87_016871 [Populus deltoides]
MIENVTHGYTAAGFSGRKPCTKLADSIVRCANEKWKAKVKCGDAYRILSNEADFSWKARQSVRRQSYSSHLEKEQLSMNDSRPLCHRHQSGKGKLILQLLWLQLAISLISYRRILW